jgi:hypothetical protein
MKRVLLFMRHDRVFCAFFASNLFVSTPGGFGDCDDFTRSSEKGVELIARASTSFMKCALLLNSIKEPLPPYLPEPHSREPMLFTISILAVCK